MQSMVLTRERISTVYALVVLVSPHFVTSVFHRVPASALALPSVQPCAARAARVVFDYMEANNE